MVMGDQYGVSGIARTDPCRQTVTRIVGVFNNLKSVLNFKMDPNQVENANVRYASTSHCTNNDSKYSNTTILTYGAKNLLLGDHHVVHHV